MNGPGRWAQGSGTGEFLVAYGPGHQREAKPAIPEHFLSGGHPSQEGAQAGKSISGGTTLYPALC